jgi:hypothetical protein
MYHIKVFTSSEDTIDGYIEYADYDTNRLFQRDKFYEHCKTMSNHTEIKTLDGQDILFFKFYKTYYTIFFPKVDGLKSIAFLRSELLYLRFDSISNIELISYKPSGREFESNEYQTGDFSWCSAITSLTKEEIDLLQNEPRLIYSKTLFEMPTEKYLIVSYDINLTMADFERYVEKNYYDIKNKYNPYKYWDKFIESLRQVYKERKIVIIIVPWDNT